jgi:hypothetical protein
MLVDICPHIISPIYENSTLLLYGKNEMEKYLFYKGIAFTQSVLASVGKNFAVT